MLETAEVFSSNPNASCFLKTSVFVLSRLLFIFFGVVSVAHLCLEAQSFPRICNTHA